MKRQDSKLEKRNHLFAIAFASPAAVFSIILIIYPLIQIVSLSFQKVKFFGGINQVESGFTFANYLELFSSNHFWNALSKSLLFTGIALALSFLLGLGLALLLNERFRFQKAVRTLILLAWPIPGVVVAILAKWMFDPNLGIVNQILMSLHIIKSNIKWVADSFYASVLVISTTIWKTYPAFTLTLLAGLKSVPAELYEAASIDGAGVIRRFFNVTIPAIWSVIVSSLLMNGLWMFRNFDLVYSITGGGPSRATQTLPLLLYQEAFKYFDLGYASSVGVVSLLISAIFVVLCIPALKKQFY